MGVVSGDEGGGNEFRDCRKRRRQRRRRRRMRRSGKRMEDWEECRTW